MIGHRPRFSFIKTVRLLISETFIIPNAGGSNIASQIGQLKITQVVNVIMGQNAVIPNYE